ncbi:MAG: retention module-containing protein, partial [Pseudomonadales bacterium]
MAASVIAIVLEITGQAYARNSDGELRELSVGDKLLEGEVLITSADGRVELEMRDGHPMIVDSMPEMTLTADLLASESPALTESGLEGATIATVVASRSSAEDFSELLEAP